MRRVIQFQTMLCILLLSNAAYGWSFFEESRWHDAVNSESNSELSELADDDSWMVRSAVGGNEYSSGHVLSKLAKDTETLVRSAVAKNRFTPQTALAALANDQDAIVRESVAKNESASDALLDQLASDERRDVRSSVAQNRNATAATLERLTEDDTEIRTHVARHPNTSTETLEKLAGDKEQDVRYAVVHNGHANLWTLIALMRDEDSNIRDVATREVKNWLKIECDQRQNEAGCAIRAALRRTGQLDESD